MTVSPTGVWFHLVVVSAICYIFKKLISSFKKREAGKKLWICWQREISWTKFFCSSRPAAPQPSEPYSPTPYSNTSMKAESPLKSTVCLSICSQIILFLPSLSSVTLEDQSVLTDMLHGITQRTYRCAFLACTSQLLFLAVTSQRIVLPLRRGSFSMRDLSGGVALLTHWKWIPRHTLYFQSFWPGVKSCHMETLLASTGHPEMLLLTPVSMEHCPRLYGKLDFFSVF